MQKNNYKWPCSIAMLVYWRVLEVHFQEEHRDLGQCQKPVCLLVTQW